MSQTNRSRAITVGGTSANTNAVTLDEDQDVAGVKTFNVPPRCAVNPSIDSELSRKGYVDTFAKLSGANRFTNSNPVKFQTNGGASRVLFTEEDTNDATNAALNFSVVDDVNGELTITAHALTLENSSGQNALKFDGGVGTFSVPPVCATQASTNSQLTNKLFVDTLNNTNVKTSTDQVIEGEKTFRTLPKASDANGSDLSVSDDKELVPKKYVDDELTTGLNTTIRTTGNQVGIAGIKIFDFAPRSSSDPSISTDLTRKGYVDTNFPKLNAASTFTNASPITCTTSSGTSEIRFVKEGDANNNGTIKYSINDVANGDLRLESHSITLENASFDALQFSAGVGTFAFPPEIQPATPSTDYQLATKKYVDDAVGGSSFVTGMIIIWSGAANAIPTGWVICDGTNSTPNLSGKFVLGYGSTGSTTGNAKSGTVGGNAEDKIVEADHIPPISIEWNENGRPFADFPNASVTDYAMVKANNNDGFTQINNKAFWIGTMKDIGASSVSAQKPYYPPYYVLAYIMKT